MIPTSILPDLPWSFNEPVPSSLQEFIQALAAYSEEHLQAELAPELHAELEQEFPGGVIVIHYFFSTRGGEAGTWELQQRQVRLYAEGHPLTHAAILWRLHEAAHEDLAGGEPCFFEGLELVRQPEANEVPTYELHTGH